VVYDQILRKDVHAGGRRRARSHRLAPGGPVHREHANIGDADIALGRPAVHVAAGDGLYSCPRAHQHWHFQHTPPMSCGPGHRESLQAAKRGFCMIDVCRGYGGIQSPGSWVYHVCGRPAGALGAAIVGNQGISTGRADQYYKWPAGSISSWMARMGKSAGAAGQHVIRIHVNPPFPCTKFDRATTGGGSAGHVPQLFESRYDNNVAEAPITLPASSPRQDRLRRAAGRPRLTSIRSTTRIGRRRATGSE